jgi:hypothetical protein
MAPRTLPARPSTGPGGAYPSGVALLRRLTSTALLAALLAACTGSGPDDRSGADAAPGAGTATTATTATVAPREDPGAGPDATALGPFDFVADAVGGGQVVGADFAGSETVVWFWAPW